MVSRERAVYTAFVLAGAVASFLVDRLTDQPFLVVMGLLVVVGVAAPTAVNYYLTTRDG